MDYKELQSKSGKEIEKMLDEERARLFGLRMKISVNQVRNVREIRVVKEIIAQMKTHLSALSREVKK
ncbi:MAG: 50S ribosomal protein L29 [Patescibacteria group bacterium]|jgi:ribosomal protein L29